MNKRGKAAGLAALMILAAGTARAEIYSATFERLSGAAAALGASQEAAAGGAEAALGGMYSGSAFSGEAPVVYAAVPAARPAAVPEAKTLKFAVYAAPEAKVEKKEEGKDGKEGKEEAKPVELPVFGTHADDKNAVVGFYFGLTLLLVMLAILL